MKLIISDFSVIKVYMYNNKEKLFFYLKMYIVYKK